MSERDKTIEQSISTLSQNESFQQTKKILEKLKNEVVDIHEKKQVTTLLNNLETIKTAESSELTEQIDTIYSQLIQLKAIENLELTEEEILSITTLTEIISGVKTELLDLKEAVSEYHGANPLDKNDDELDAEVNTEYTGNSPLDKKTNPTVTIPAGSIATAGGVVLGFLGIRRARKKLKARRERKKLEKAGNNTESNNNNTENNNTKTPKKKSKFWRRTLGILGIGGGIYARSKFRKGDWSFEKLRDGLRGTEKGPEINPVLDNEEAAADGFEDLLNGNTEAQEKAKEYTAIGNNINTFSNDIYSFSDGTINKPDDIAELGKGKDKYAGAIPYIMDNTYEDIDDMNDKIGLFQLMAKANSNELITEIKRRATEGMDEKNFLVRSVLKILGYNTLKEFVDGGGNKVDDQKVDEVNMVFQKALKVMAYVNFAENAYMMKEIAGKDIQKKAGEDADGDIKWENIEKPADTNKYSKLIQKILDNPDKYRVGTSGDYSDIEAIREKFRNKKIVDIAALDIKLSDIKDANLDVYKNIAKIDQDRENYHKDIENGRGDKVMETLMESCEDELSDSIFASLTHAMPIMTLLELTGLNSEAELKKEYLKNSGFKKLIQSYKDRFEKSGSLTYDEQKQVVDEYLTLLKEINSTNAALQETVDENGNFRLTISSTFSQLVGNTRHAFTTGFYLGVDTYNNYKDGNYVTGTGKLAMGTFYLAGATGVTMMGLGGAGRILSRGKSGGKTFKAGRQLALAPITVPAHIVKKYAKTGTLRHRLSKYMHHGMLKRLYKGEKLSNALANGLPFSKAYKVYASDGRKFKNQTNLSRNDFFERVFDTKNTKNSKPNDVLGKYLFSETKEGHDVPAENANAIWRKFRRKFIDIDNTPEIRKVNKFTLTDEFLAQIKPLANQITEGKVLRQFASDLSLKQMSSLSKIFDKNPKILKLLNKTSDNRKLQALISQIIYDHKAGNIPELNQLKKISGVEKVKGLTDSQKILKSKIETNVDDIAHEIKNTKSQLLSKVGTEVKYKTIEGTITKIQGGDVFIETKTGIEVPINKKILLDSESLKINHQVLDEFENHKKNLQQILKNIDQGQIDKSEVSILTELFKKTGKNFGVQKRLIKNLADDGSEIHDAIRALKGSELEAKNASQTIKRLLKINKTDDIRKGIFGVFKKMKFSKYTKLLKGISYLT